MPGILRTGRYYADDDKQSLTDLIRAERAGAGENYEQNFASHVRQGIERDELAGAYHTPSGVW